MIVVLAILVSNIQLSSTTSCFCTSRDYVIPVFSENNETEYSPGILMKNECFAGRIQGDLFCPDNQSFCLNQESLYATPCAQVSPGYIYILPLFNSTEYEEELLAIYYEENENRKRFLLQDDARGWGQWEQWQACVAEKCGENGLRTRVRKCLLEPDGKCSGDSFEIRSCLQNCKQPNATDNWSDWSEWSSCEKSCDSIMSNRTRDCNAFDTFTCVGDGFEERPCKVDGSWSLWSSWSQCSINYTENNGGLTHRLRKCDSPAPACGGEQCNGTSWEITTCAEIHGWTKWTEWSGCIPVADVELKLRERKCKDDDCVGENFEYELCTNKTYIIWSLWSPCSATCDKGQRSRKGFCAILGEFKEDLHPVRNPSCTNETESCINSICEGSGISPWSEWTSWSPCYPPCDDGSSTRTRQCLDKNGCQDLSVETTNCSQSLCKVDGDWSPWEEWSQCRFIQDNNFVVRFRNCTNPPPKKSGKDCSGNNYEIDVCKDESTWGEWVTYGHCIKTNEGDITGFRYRNRTCHTGLNKEPCQGNHQEKIHCSLQGKWSRWGNWSACSQTCGQGFKQRFRSCINANDLECDGSRMENVTCLDVQNCPIDGSLTEWSEWSQCHVTCGGGPISRNRYCENPRPQYGGKNCEGPLTETWVCNTKDCPADGGWSSWSTWTSCSVTCENGTQSRNRSCNMPKPAHGGQDCQGDPIDTSICSQKSCPIDGGWSDWGPWTNWDVTCARGSRSRQRRCDSPTPLNGGHYCPGDRNDFDSKDLVNCPVDGEWSEWSEWFGCTATCGEGTNTRYRVCDNPLPAYHGRGCPAQDFKEIVKCHPGGCPVNGKWGLWLEWERCSVSCGDGTRLRHRLCDNPKPIYGGTNCTWTNTDSGPCNRGPCPVDGSWGHWGQWSTCSGGCPDGSKIRVRQCDSPKPLYGGDLCKGMSNETGVCLPQTCKVDGGWGSWLSWESCSKTCGEGVAVRHRPCDNPPPLYGGAYCSGTNENPGSCNIGPCPVDGAWGGWERWSDCNGGCPNGIKKRFRDCDSPTPVNGGDYCKGVAYEIAVCLPFSCTVDGGWGSWLSWESCSKTCGDGVAVRHRPCDNPPPKYGGANCSGTNESSGSCNIGPCPVDGLWGAWENWSRCTGTCPTGNKKRFRICDSPAPANGGAFCEGQASESIGCLLLNCTTTSIATTATMDGGWSAWSSWFGCSVTCGPGTDTRYRACNNPAPQNGGSYCPGSFSDHSSCNQVSCVVDGQWSSWSAWFGCSATCGQGTDHRYRACDNPKPQNGGSYCHGSYSETTACNDAPCIVDGGWSDWGAWEVCSVTCSNGTSVRRRTCDSPKPKDGGKQCAGNSIDVKGCSLRLCPVDGNWGNWTPWSRCMGNCSTANKERFRNCDNPLPENRGKTCEGPPFEMIPCIPLTCATVLTNAVARNVRDTIPYWSPWFYGECSATYGPGTTKRLRHCSTGNDKDCMGPAVEDVACNE